MNFDLNIAIDVFKELLPFTKTTLFIAAVALVFSLLLAILLALIVRYKVPVLLQITKVYVSFFRSTPILSQLFFFYFGLTQFVPFLNDLSPTTSIILVLSMNEAAFMSETLRGALESVDKGQREAALSVGMTELQAMRRIIIPQAFRVALPGLSNSFISLIKGSSLGFTIGVIEIMSQAKLISARNYRVMEAYMAALAVYWIVVGILSKGQKYIENKFNKAY
ncbi:MAG: amino acid ABC transporter permease [Peptoniphilus sp.]|nr:amino acid ABC transporter permease [Peptoniphilus sp.]MDD7362773.1 amino acid ABC transporter permease [Bacillota bacterium]MDY6044035.1 amino acid ABC transporter permease [Peptoniphilus sp.]